MSKLCKKCSKEIPQNSKKDICENCQNKTLGMLRIIGEGVLMIGGVVLAIITNGKLGGGSKT